MKHACLNCKSADMVHEARDIAVSHRGFETTLRQLHGWHCPNCGEIEFDEGEGERYAKALDELRAQERTGQLERESARQLAALGGSQPHLKATHRRQKT